MTGSDIIIDTLKENKVTDVFLVSGGGMMYMLDALGKSGLNLHFHHHEQDAAIAAEAYAKVSSKIGVCFATSGPGGLNCVEAIAECFVDCTPVVFFIGQNKINQTTRASGIQGLRQYGASEIDILPVLTPITKQTFLADSIMALQDALSSVWPGAANYGTPGPVAIIVPLDIQNAVLGNKSVINKAIGAWNNAKHPLIFLGKGSRKWFDCIYRSIEGKNIPIVTTMAGKDIIPYSDPSFIGHVGGKGDRAGNYAIQNADVIFCDGTSLHVFNTGYELDKFAPNAKIFYFQFEDALRQKCILKNAIMISDNLAFFSEELLANGPVFDPSWLIHLRSLKAKHPVYAEPHKVEEGRLNIYKALEIINEWSDNYDIVISDAGSSFYTVGQAWQLKGGQRYISSNGLGTMGWALPAATGAYLANKQRVLCFTGDGSFIMGSTELGALKKNAVNTIIFVFNNNGYVSIRNTQDTFFDGRYVGTDEEHGVGMVEASNLAAAYDLPNWVVSSEKELRAALIKQNKCKGPKIIEILTNIHQEIIPNVQSYIDETGKIVSGTLDNMYPPMEVK